MLLGRFPSLPNWSSTFAELDEARRGMERLFGSLSEFGGARAAGVFPAVNVSESSDALLVRAELPGIDARDLEITMENDTLTIAGERKMSEESDHFSCHRREREWGKFRRSLTVPLRIDSNGVRAGYRDGVLTVTLPKAPEARPKRIDVQAQA